MNGDITQLGDFLNTWLPEQFNKTIPPIVDRAEQNITLAHDKIRSTIRDNVVNSRLAVSKAQTTVMDHIADRLGAVESRIDNAHKKILTSLDEKLIPLETMIPANMSCPTEPIPIGGGRCLVGVCDPATGTTVGYENLPCPNGTSGGLGFPPTQPGPCPPVECPPPKPCPKPDSCILIDIYRTACRYRDDACVYMVLTGSERLHEDDTLISSQVLCDEEAALIFVALEAKCDELPICKVPKPGGVIINEPLPVVNCPCPIVNFQPPIGGGIINNPYPINPIINVPEPPIILPPYPSPMPPGVGLNVQINCPKPDKTKGECAPSGDMAYYSMECNDDSKIKALWVEMAGGDLSNVFGSNTPVDWFKNAAKDILTFAIDYNPLSPVTIRPGE